MKNLTKVFLSLILVIINIKGKTQYDGLEDISKHWELGITGGYNAFFGDLGGNKGKGQPFIKDFNSPTVKPLAGLFANYFLYSWMSGQMEVKKTHILTSF